VSAPESENQNPYAAPRAQLGQRATSNDWHPVGFWARTIGAVIDGIALMIITALLIWLGVQEVEQADIGSRIDAPWWLFSVYFLGFWIVKSTTLGKMLFSARIVDAYTGKPASAWQCVGRFAMSLVSAWVLGLGYLWIAFNDRKRGWHDLVAGTAVVVGFPAGAYEEADGSSIATPDYRCRACGHRLWTAEIPLPQSCPGCGRPAAFDAQ
jgi:uncharacterized RDD family membrane protein YckC